MSTQNQSSTFIRQPTKTHRKFSHCEPRAHCYWMFFAWLSTPDSSQYKPQNHKFKRKVCARWRFSLLRETLSLPFAILAYSTSLPVSAEGFLTPALSSLNNFAFSAIANWQLGVMSCFIMCGCEWWEWINELQKSYVLWFALKSIETAQKIQFISFSSSLNSLKTLC